MTSLRAPAVLLALGGGLLAATQARVNGQLSQLVGNPIAGALLSAATGLVLITPIAWMAAPIRADRRPAHRHP